MVSRLKVISRIFVLGADATERGKMDPSLNRSWENERTQNLGAQALENMPSYSEHMQNREEASREKLFSELSASERPAGVRDEQDYREYLAEKRAKEAENERRLQDYQAELEQRRANKLDESYECLSKWYSKDEIDSLIYETRCATEVGEDGNRHYKLDENGQLIQYVDKSRMKQSFEYMFDGGISIKDLSEADIISADRREDLANINRFMEDWYYLTDTEYCKGFNKKYTAPMRNLHSIIQKRKTGEPLSEEDRDFAYDCYPENVAKMDGEEWTHNTGVADRLLFGAPYCEFLDFDKREPGAFLLGETERVVNDAPEKYVDRIRYINLRLEGIREGLAQGGGFTPEGWKNYRETRSLVEKSIWKNLPALYNKIEDLGYYDEEEEGEDEDEAESYLGYSSTHINPASLKQYGNLLLENCNFNGYGFGPAAWAEENDWNESGIGFGEAMMMCGISSDKIIDSFFGGPERSELIPERMTYPDRAAKMAGELVKIGIPKEDIVDNFRRKNISSFEHGDMASVFIDDRDVEEMRQGGFSNVEILDAMHPIGVRYDDAKSISELKGMGFSDGDMFKHLTNEIRRLDSQNRE